MVWPNGVGACCIKKKKSREMLPYMTTSLWWPHPQAPRTSTALDGSVFTSKLLNIIHTNDSGICHIFQSRAMTLLGPPRSYEPSPLLSLWLCFAFPPLISLPATLSSWPGPVLPWSYFLHSCLNVLILLTLSRSPQRPSWVASFLSLYLFLKFIF